MSEVLKPVTSTVNSIRFHKFTGEIEETDLPYHTAGLVAEVLQCCFEHQAALEIFSNGKHGNSSELQNSEWL